MYMTDFEYDGYKLSDFGCMVGYAVTSIDENPSMGSNVSLETVRNNGTYTDEIVNAKYDQPFTMTFDIVKASCPNIDENNDYFTDKELSFFMRWLNRKRYYKFIPIYDNHEFYKMHFMGTFTEIKAINIGGNVIGLTLTFVANAPFGFLSLTDNTFNIPSNGIITLTDFSDEIGSVYPASFVLTCKDSGDYQIQHRLQSETTWTRLTEIKNCVSGEIITMDCVHKVITTSETTHTTLFNDFNYVFPRLTNTLEEKINEFKVNKECEITISYNPIRKVGVIV